MNRTFRSHTILPFSSSFNSCYWSPEMSIKFCYSNVQKSIIKLASCTAKKGLLFQISTFEFKKCVPLKLFEFQEQFTIGAFLIKLTQFETTGQVM